MASLGPDDHLAQSEWAFALWAVATGPTIEALIGDWESIVAALPSARLDALTDAIIRMNQHRVLRNRPTTAKGTTQLTKELLAGRNPQPGPTKLAVAPIIEQAAPGPLAATAREQKWLLVDAVAPYE